MIRKIFFGGVLGGMLGCILGILASVVFSYISHFDPGLANYQRDLWSLTALLLAVIL